jgi:hypothetical protein
MATTEISEGTPEQSSEQLLSALEPEQLTGAKREQLPRRYLKGAHVFLLWSLRLYLLFMIVVVTYQILTGVQ